MRAIFSLPRDFDVCMPTKLSFNSIEIIVRLISEHVSKRAWLRPFHISPFCLFVLLFHLCSLARSLSVHLKMSLCFFFLFCISFIHLTHSWPKRPHIYTNSLHKQWNIGRHFIIRSRPTEHQRQNNKLQLVVIVAFNFRFSLCLR